MMQESEYAYPPVTDALLHEIVRRIRTVSNPIAIILFGSHARGDARPDSDLDILIIEETSLPRHRRGAAYRRALAGVFPAKDIVVRTPAEVQKWADTPNAFITMALREGKVLYERND
ncbi:nucleotidyltransferase domain-containing protein [Roseiflexus castenholzii]|jgi:predicted nucleotidyltransferase|uniref:DNA polymerase beta domain protein region n=1 Tax=Roseiflexus castenholzii (strain DSM 13941 / HLO8) TaxID=383372 RepID=A7NLN4_ROSCS|nr:nucleotidyltransferase domain-containing protein [Roseiflexus castenholzii]ABU58430.1 DNA polymerase beta domain protein region [Roseiflexus castenholzii DSM 13941]